MTNIGPEVDMECTMWPDGWPTWLGGTGSEWHHCCVAHDLVPITLQSNLNLWDCVSKINHSMGLIMFIGLFLFSGIYGIIKYRGKK